MAAVSAIALATAWNAADTRAALDAHAHPFHGHRSMVVHGSLPFTDHHSTTAGPPTPARLTRRILYLPSHSDKATHLPVYDFAADFTATVKDAPLGSSRFKTAFGLMPKPCGDGRGSSSVSYLLDFEPLEARMAVGAAGARRKSSFGGGGVARGGFGGGGATTRATVTRRMLFAADVEVGLTIQPCAAPGTLVEDGAAACTLSPASTTLEIPVVTSFPVAPTVTRFGASRNVWFTFTVQSLLDEARTLQWQVHPTELGMLRYTLVEIPTRAASSTPSAGGNAQPDEMPYSAADPANEHLIRAIYHNVGLGFSLCQPCSEGVLLIQDDFDPETEALVLASLIGLLWRVRSEENKPRKMSKSEVHGKPARKTSIGEDEPASSPEKKGRLLSKILRKKSA